MNTQFVQAFSGDEDQERRLIQSLDGMNYAGVQDHHMALLKIQLYTSKTTEENNSQQRRWRKVRGNRC
jgi:hypothetical protein